MDDRAFGSWTSAPDSAQKTSFSCAPVDGVKVLGSGRPPGYPPAGYPAQNFYVWADFPFLREGARHGSYSKKGSEKGSQKGPREGGFRGVA